MSNLSLNRATNVQIHKPRALSQIRITQPLQPKPIEPLRLTHSMFYKDVGIKTPLKPLNTHLDSKHSVMCTTCHQGLKDVNVTELRAMAFRQTYLQGGKMPQPYQNTNYPIPQNNVGSNQPYPQYQTSINQPQQFPSNMNQLHQSFVNQSQFNANTNQFQQQFPSNTIQPQQPPNPALNQSYPLPPQMYQQQQAQQYQNFPNQFHPQNNIHTAQFQPWNQQYSASNHWMPEFETNLAMGNPDQIGIRAFGPQIYTNYYSNFLEKTYGITPELITSLQLSGLTPQQIEQQKERIILEKTTRGKRNRQEWLYPAHYYQDAARQHLIANLPPEMRQLPSRVGPGPYPPRTREPPKLCYRSWSEPGGRKETKEEDVWQQVMRKEPTILQKYNQDNRRRQELRQQRQQDARLLFPKPKPKSTCKEGYIRLRDV